MILCEFTPDGEDMIRIAMTDVALESQWFNFIQSFSSLKMTTEQVTGGYVEPSFSDLKLSPAMYDTSGEAPASWPPAATATVVFIETSTNRAGGTVLFEGNAALGDYDRYSVSYTIEAIEDDTVIAEDTVLSGTLLSIITTYCGASYLNLTVDSTNARSPTPTISYTVTSDTTTRDLLSDMSAECTHAFEIIDGVLYLQDLLVDANLVEVTEFDVFACTYSGPAYLDDIPEDEDDMSYVYNDSIHRPTELANITTMLSSDIATIPCPIDDSKPRVLDTISLYDKSAINPITSVTRITSVIYNFDTNRMQMEGLGTIS